MANPLTIITGLGAGKSEVKGLVKRDWVPTGRIDFATKLERDTDPNKPSDSRSIQHSYRLATRRSRSR